MKIWQLSRISNCKKLTAGTVQYFHIVNKQLHDVFQIVGNELQIGVIFIQNLYNALALFKSF